MQVRSREITASDIEAVVELLSKGFSERSRRFWARALQRLTNHPTPPGFPKYGYALEASGSLVGVLLTIVSETPGTPSVRCSVSSWYVEPRYRAYATILTSAVLRDRRLTYLNITPHPRTWAMLDAQGWKRYCNGRQVSLPLLTRISSARVKLRRVHAREPFEHGGLSPYEIELLRHHADYGCISVVASTRNDALPFVFLRISKFGVPCAYLAYCRDVESYVRIGRQIGWYLATRFAILVVLVDANGPVPGLIGPYFNRTPKFYKGPQIPALGDLAYTERVMFRF